MTVEVSGHLQDMVEQLMVAAALDRPEDVVGQAVEAMYARLSQAEKRAALERMVQAGFESGPSHREIKDVFGDIYARLEAAEVADSSKHSRVA